MQCQVLLMGRLSQEHLSLHILDFLPDGGGERRTQIETSLGRKHCTQLVKGFLGIADFESFVRISHLIQLAEFVLRHPLPGEHDVKYRCPNACDICVKVPATIDVRERLVRKHRCLMEGPLQLDIVFGKGYRAEDTRQYANTTGITYSCQHIKGPTTEQPFVEIFTIFWAKERLEQERNSCT